MFTTVSTRVVVATVAFGALALAAPIAGAQTTTGALPTPQSPPSTAPQQTATTPAPAAPSTTTETKPADAVANAATPSAPPAAPAATPPATSPPAAAASTPVAPTPPAETPATSTATATPPPAPDATPPATPSPAAAQTTPATTPPAATPPAQAQAPAAPVVDATIAAVRTWLGTPANVSKSSKDDVAAAVSFYGSRTGGPLWVESSGFNAKAKSAMDEVRKADDWGLSAAAFDLPSLADGTPTAEALAAAEGKLTLELLKYARYARGGRVNPSSLSRILDQTPPVKDPNTVITELAAAPAPDAYLRDQHPKHPQFQLLHKALLKARGPSGPAVEVDPALKITLQATKVTLKRGVDDPAVSTLRQRLKVPAEAGASDTLFDEKLELALKAYQVEKGIKATGTLSGATRVSLNKEVDAQRAPDPERGTQRIVLNMERWRWMPENLGSVYVQNNIPEYTTRVFKGNEVIFKERIIVGLPEWATPVFSETMKTIVFNPSWGMPDGIKSRELAPRLRSAGGGFLFFGGGGGGNIIRAYGLDVYRQGRKVDPDSVDWSNADLRNYSFIQPPGGKNPLGVVKFLFPNKHDVYMHDTIERSLFAQPNRALSHGCIRVQNPRQFAEVMIEQANGLDRAGVERAVAGGGDVTLKNPIPVHMTYFTAVADEQGHVSTFSDLYGHDSRLSSALTGRALRLDPVIETSAADPVSDESGAGTKQQKKKKKNYSAPDTLADAISGFWMN